MVALDEDSKPLGPEVIATQEQAPKKPIPWDPRTWNQVYYGGDDKIEHGIAGAVIAFFTYLIIENELTKLKLTWQAKVVIGILIAVGVAFVAMFGKEFWDALGNGMADVWDMACGVLGALTLGVVVILVYAWFRARASP
jgi:hypothetical protein